MNYTAHGPKRRATRAAEASARAPRSRASVEDASSRGSLLAALGATVRARRLECGLTRRALAEQARVSERFLVQLEGGVGNISVARLADVATALDTRASTLLADAEKSSDARPARPRRVIALLGLRGAGKSTLGPRLARRLGVPFVELDELVARDAGMGLSTLFEIHGEAYFRRLERETLARFFASHDAAVIATSGSIVNDPETYALLRQKALTVWLKARPRDHWDRVVAQGDGRPMRDRANAMSELRALLETREPLYAKADEVVDTSALSPDDAVARLASAAEATAHTGPRPRSMTNERRRDQRGKR